MDRQKYIGRHLQELTFPVFKHRFNKMAFAKIFETARAQGVSIMLIHLSSGIEAILRRSIGSDVMKEVSGDEQVGALARAVTSSLFDGGEEVDGLHTFGTLDHDLFHFRLGDGLQDSFRYLMYRITTPSRPEEWSTVSLGNRSISLHSFTRPFGVVSKVIPALWRRYTSSRTSSQN